MERAGILLGGAAISSGIGAGILLMSNLIIWAVIAAWIGSGLAFIGFGLIIFAMSTRASAGKGGPEQVSPGPVVAEPVVVKAA